jgi:hypothetical protein
MASISSCCRSLQHYYYQIDVLLRGLEGISEIGNSDSSTLFIASGFSVMREKFYFAITCSAPVATSFL